MKMTGRQLKRLVEQLTQAHPRGDLGKNITDAEFPVLVGYEGKSEIVYNQDELDELLDYLTVDNNIAYSLDSLADVEVKDLPAGAKIEMMESAKISKSRIRSIIQESVRGIAEQVVGYKAPESDEDDKDQDWVQTGSLSGPAEDETQMQTRVATSTRQATAQRQDDLDKGDAVAADEDAEELQGLVDKQNESLFIPKRVLTAMIRESLLRENAVLEDYIKEEIANSNDPGRGQMAKQELIDRTEGAGYKIDDVEKSLEKLVADGVLAVEGEDEETTITLER